MPARKSAGWTHNSERGEIAQVTEAAVNETAAAKVWANDDYLIPLPSCKVLISDAVAATTERCAQVINDLANRKYDREPIAFLALADAAAAIRARKD